MQGSGLADNIKKKIAKVSTPFLFFIFSNLAIQELSDFKNDTKHNPGFALKPVIRDENDPKWGMDWNVTIFATDDLFIGSKFFLKIHLEPDFPNSAPKCTFTTPVPFHPNVAQASGYICYELLKSDWTKNKNMSIPALVTSLKAFLANPNFSNPFREEPASLHKEDPKKYVARVKKLTKEQNST